MTDSSLTIYSFVSISTIITLAVVVTAVGGQINRYINPTWLEMDANSEFYPGGEVISQILRDYGLGDGHSRYRSPSSAAVLVDRNNGYGGGPRSHSARNRILANNAYESPEPYSALEYVDRNYDYVDGAIRSSSNRYRNDATIDVPPRRNRMNAIALPRTIRYYPSEDYGVDLPDVSSSSQPYTRPRWLQLRATSNVDPSAQESALRNRETARLVPRSTVAPNTGEKQPNV